jgi:hypothetical protein
VVNNILVTKREYIHIQYILQTGFLNTRFIYFSISATYHKIIQDTERTISVVIIIMYVTLLH